VRKCGGARAKRKCAGEFKESVLTKRLGLRADAAKIGTLKAIRKT
jgi:hypothetical protein